MEIIKTSILGVSTIQASEFKQPIFIIDMDKVSSYQLACLLEKMDDDVQFIKRGKYLIIG